MTVAASLDGVMLSMKDGKRQEKRDKRLSKATFYGIDYYNESQVRIWSYPRGNTQHTVNVLERIRQENPERQMTIIWDGASYHRSFEVCEAAKKLKIE